MKSLIPEVNQISVESKYYKEFENRLNMAEIKFSHIFQFFHGYHAYQLTSKTDKERAFKIRGNIYTHRH